MKKLLLIIAIAISGFAIAGNGFGVKYAETTKGSSQLEFTLGKYAIATVQHGGQTYATIKFDGGVTTMKKGWASLPFISGAIQLPADKNVSIDIANSEYKDIVLEYPLEPSRGVIYRNQDPTKMPYVIDPASVTDAWYPADLAKAEAPFILRDVRGTSVKVYPFQYNAKQNTLRVYSKVVVSVEENDTPVINPLKKQTTQITAEANSWYKSLFVNYKENRDLTMANIGDIHVIYTARDAEAIQPYIDWKREKGFNVTSEEVAVGTNVKNNVQTAYDNNNNLLYVQLVGDWADIKCDLGGGASAPMDPMLGCVVGSDNYPDLAVGRFSGSSPEQITVQVNKAINYEKIPDNEGTWYKAAMNIASAEGSGSGDDGEQDKVHSQIIYDNKLDPFTYDEQYQVYAPGATSGMVGTGVNNGVSIINYTGHGSENSFVTSGFNNNNVSTLTNANKLPFIISVACVNGKFHMNGGDCFAEAWLKKENGGAVMTLMSTINQPWQPPMRGQDYINDILVGGYDYTNNPGSGTNVTEGRTILGSIVVNGFVLMYAESSNESDLNTIQTWTTFGDCALQARTDTPKAISLSNDVILVGSDYTTVVTDANGNPVEGAMVCLSKDGNYASSITNANGEVTVANAFEPGEAKLTVTAFNTQTISQNIAIITPDGPYLLVDKIEVDNAENMAMYNSTFTTKLTVRNVGTAAANNVTIQVTPEANDCLFLSSNNTISIANIDAGGSVEIENAYTFEAARYVPDGTVVNVDFVINAPNKTTWESSKSIKINAPALGLEFVRVNDDAANGNARLDVGETASLVFKVNNTGHAASLAGKVHIASASSDITLNSTEITLPVVETASNQEVSFEVSVAASATEGSLADFAIDAVADKYNTSLSTVLGIGLVMEDFETGDFSKFPWTFDGDQPWEVINADPYEGSYCAVSKDINDSQSSVMKVNASNTSPQTMSFYYKVSSESNYDKFNFYIDGTEQGAWSGEVPWTQASYTLQPGDHELKWEYKKDIMVSVGGDCAWVDNIVMPAVGSNLFANFSANSQVVCKNEKVAFTVTNANATSYEWTFEGGTPATSTDATPEVRYNAEGHYKVTLKVSDGTNESTIVKENFVTVENCWVGIEDIAAPIADFHLYPNPNNGQLTLEVEAQSDIQIYNNMGALVYQGQLQAGTNHINLQQQAKGVYIVRVIANEQTMVKKMIVQ